MTADRAVTDYLQDILDALEKVEEFTHELDYAAFSTDDKTAYAVIRALEIIGEATKRVPDTVRDKHPEGPVARDGRHAR